MSSDNPGLDKSHGRFNEQTANETTVETDNDGNQYADQLPAGSIIDATSIRLEHDNEHVEQAYIYPGPDRVSFCVGDGLGRLVRSVSREWWDAQIEECDTEAGRINKAMKRALRGDD